MVTTVEYEKLVCTTSFCNLHDFKINAGGVCAYVDYMYLLQQSNTSVSADRIVEVQKGLNQLIEQLSTTIQLLLDKPIGHNDSPTYTQPLATTTDSKQTGGVPLGIKIRKGGESS